MKLYKVSTNAIDMNPQWAGSQSEAAKLRKGLVSDQGFKRAEIVTEEVEVPTNKAGLIEFLNGLT